MKTQCAGEADSRIARKEHLVPHEQSEGIITAWAATLAKIAFFCSSPPSEKFKPRRKNQWKFNILSMVENRRSSFQALSLVFDLLHQGSRDLSERGLAGSSTSMNRRDSAARIAASHSKKRSGVDSQPSRL